MKILTTEQLAKKMARDGNPMIVEVLGVEKIWHGGAPVLIVVHVSEAGEEFGVILDKRYADDLTERLGPHPLVEEFFRLH
jgi:hypothetical protein